MEEYHAECQSCKRKIYILGNVYLCNYCSSPDWNKYFKIAEKHSDIKDIINWFDTMILQKFHIASKPTLDVRIRIVCGMINKNTFLTRELKMELMELIWAKYKQRTKIRNEFIAKSIFKVPF